MNIEEMVKKENKIGWIAYANAIKYAQGLIQEDEQLIYATIVNLSYVPINSNTFDNKNMIFGGAGQLRKTLSGILAITDKKVLFVNSVLGQTEQKQMRIEDINSMEEFIRFGVGELRIKGITEIFIIKINKWKQQIVIKQSIEKAQELKKQNNNVNISSISNADEIRKYKQLYDDGIITQEEFEKKKKELL